MKEKDLPKISQDEGEAHYYSYKDFENNRVRICASGISEWHVDHELCSSIRASILFVAPLLHRCGKVELYPPGGDVIGRRRLDTHFY